MKKTQNDSKKEKDKNNKAVNPFEIRGSNDGSTIIEGPGFEMVIPPDFS